MLKDPFKLEKLAAETWSAPGEQMLFRIGPRYGYEAFDIGGRRGASHTWISRFPVKSTSLPEWPLPTEPVAKGAYLGDEWVEDPTIWAYVHAPTENTAAVGCAEGLVAGRADSWLVLTNRRLAVVIPQSVTEEQPAPETEEKTGGLLGRAKAFAKGAQTFVEQARSGEEDRLLTVWEAPVPAIRGFASPHLGRWGTPRWSGQIAFQDGSTLTIVFEQQVAAESMVTAGNKIFGG